MKDKLFPSDFEVLDKGITVSDAMEKYPDSCFLMMNMVGDSYGEYTGDVFFVGTQEENSAIMYRLRGFEGGIGDFSGNNLVKEWLENRL